MGPAGPIPDPGTFFPGLFSPSLAFTVDDGWQVYSGETENSLGIEKVFKIDFVNVTEVYEPSEEIFDPQNPTDLLTSSAPDDLVGWLKDHPHLDILEEKKVTIGGLDATQLDVVVSSTPDNYPADCDGPCVQLFPDSAGIGTDYYLDFEYRIIVQDVGQEQVVVSVNTTYEPELRQAQVVLDTVGWPYYELPIGEEVSSLDRPDLALTATELGWANYVQSNDAWVLRQDDSDDSLLTFLSVGEILDPRDPVESNASPAPDNLVAWLKDHPHLNVTGEEEVEVGGVAGTQLDIEVTSTPELDSEECAAGSCVPLFLSSNQDSINGYGSFYLVEGWRNRIVVLQADDETVVVSIESPAAEADAFVPNAKELLQSVEWKD
ncbi:MAG: hypothetical protein H0U04_20310 [Rubrobacter sp.]|nr:hypothetical protein [Rubrobacter sp.]